MTTAKELYVKISGDLDRATRESDSLKAQLADAASRISDAETGLRFIVWKLMPDAREALPHMFEEYSQARRIAKESRVSSFRNLQEAQTKVTNLKSNYAQAREDLGTYADGARGAMRCSPEYRGADEKAASAEAILQSNAPKLEEAEKRLARFSELARQSFMHRVLLSVGNEGKGHFLMSLWHFIGRSLKDTEWFRRMDADRAAAERDVDDGGNIRDRAILEGAAAKAVMQQLNLAFETSLQPRRKALQDRASEVEQALNAERDAHTAHLIAGQRLSDLQEGKVEPARTARSTLAELLGKQFESASPEDLAAIKALAERPGTAGLVERAMGYSDEIRRATLDRISVMEQKDAIQATIDELEKVKRKMSRSGLSRSSKTIDNAETFMRSDMSGGFDLATLTTISIVAEAVSDMGSSSSSDWSSSSSSSSWSSSSFD